MGCCRSLVVVSLLALSALSTACRHTDPGDDPDAGPPPDGACEGLACKIANCGSKGLASTSVSGTVYAPNGTLPLYGVSVYVPVSDPGPMADGVTCGNCAASLPGGVIT